MQPYFSLLLTVKCRRNEKLWKELISKKEPALALGSSQLTQVARSGKKAESVAGQPFGEEIRLCDSDAVHHLSTKPCQLGLKGASTG